MRMLTGTPRATRTPRLQFPPPRQTQWSLRVLTLLHLLNRALKRIAIKKIDLLLNLGLC